MTSRDKLAFEALADIIMAVPERVVDILTANGYRLSSNITLPEINRAVLHAGAESRKIEREISELNEYCQAVGLTISLIMTGVSIFRTWQKTRSQRKQDLAKNLMDTRQQLRLTEEEIKKTTNDNRRKILVQTLIKYNRELAKLKKEKLTKNIWAASILVFAGLSAAFAYNQIKR